MEKLLINDVLAAVNGRLISGNCTEISSVSTNSRETSPGALFVPIRGEKFDAHDFILNAFENGAVASFVDTVPTSLNPKLTYILVDDTLVALQQLAQFYRRKFNIPVIGVTGSTGKTSTKEMIATVLSSKFPVLKTAGNFNSKIGVPLTILGIESHHGAAVIEMGMSEFGEMSRLSCIVRPDIAVISNIGITHVENLLTQDNIFLEKMHITDNMSPENFLFVNGDDHYLKSPALPCKCHISCFGFGMNCDVRADNVRIEGAATVFDLYTPGQTRKTTLPTIGKHNVYNALAAVSVGLNLGFSLDMLCDGMLQYRNIAMRQQIHNLVINTQKKCGNNANLANITLIDDSYNASPDSVLSALDVMSNLACGRKIAVLADMLELGEFAREAHNDIGVAASEKGVDILITVGKLAAFIADAADKRSIKTFSFPSNDLAFECLLPLLSNGDCVLVKGSRGMNIDWISRMILDLQIKG